MTPSRHWMIHVNRRGEPYELCRWLLALHSANIHNVHYFGFSTEPFCPFPRLSENVKKVDLSTFQPTLNHDPLRWSSLNTSASRLPFTVRKHRLLYGPCYDGELIPAPWYRCPTQSDPVRKHFALTLTERRVERSKVSEDGAMMIKACPPPLEAWPQHRVMYLHMDPHSTSLEPTQKHQFNTQVFYCFPNRCSV